MRIHTYTPIKTQNFGSYNTQAKGHKVFKKCLNKAIWDKQTKSSKITLSWFWVVHLLVVTASALQCGLCAQWLLEKMIFFLWEQLLIGEGWGFASTSHFSSGTQSGLTSAGPVVSERYCFLDIIYPLWLLTIFLPPLHIVPWALSDGSLPYHFLVSWLSISLCNPSVSLTAWALGLGGTPTFSFYMGLRDQSSGPHTLQDLLHPAWSFQLLIESIFNNSGPF